VEPLRPAKPEAAPPAEPERKPEAPPRPAPLPKLHPPAPAKRPPPLVALASRDRQRLARGRAEPDARLDLHGLHQATAFHTLIGFLRQTQACGGRLALVITGKGDSLSERGVLRSSVPHWLARPDFRDLVLGVEPAARRHGGEGALYVRLRRPRGR